MSTLFSRIVYPRSGEPGVQAAAMPLKTIPAPCAVPLDNEVVHLSGNENIYGIKFFRDQVYVGDSSTYTSIKSNGDLLKKPSGSSTIYTYSLPATGGTLALHSETTGHATTADVVLNTQSQFTDWSYGPVPYGATYVSASRDNSPTAHWYLHSNIEYVADWDPETEQEIYAEWDPCLDTGISDPNATELHGFCDSGPHDWFELSATRSEKFGYILGPTGGINSAKPVATGGYEKLNSRGMTDWVATKAFDQQTDISSIIYDYTGSWNWIFVDGEGNWFPTNNTDFYASSIQAYDWMGYPYTATRSIKPGYILGPLDGINSARPIASVEEVSLSARNGSGYVLGNQTDKPIAKVEDTKLDLNGFNNWTYAPETFQLTGYDGTVTTDYASSYELSWDDWMGMGYNSWWINGPDYNPYEISTDANATQLTYTLPTDMVDWASSVTITATRSRKPGYILGSQTTMPIAAANEMSIVPGTGADSDKSIITLKDGTSAAVVTKHIVVTGQYNDVAVSNLSHTFTQIAAFVAAGVPVTVELEYTVSVGQGTCEFHLYKIFKGANESISALYFYSDIDTCDERSYKFYIDSAHAIVSKIGIINDASNDRLVTRYQATVDESSLPNIVIDDTYGLLSYFDRNRATPILSLEIGGSDAVAEIQLPGSIVHYIDDDGSWTIAAINFSGVYSIDLDGTGTAPWMFDVLLRGPESSGDPDQWTATTTKLGGDSGMFHVTADADLSGFPSSIGVTNVSEDFQDVLNAYDAGKQILLSFNLGSSLGVINGIGIFVRTASGYGHIQFSISIYTGVFKNTDYPYLIDLTWQDDGNGGDEWVVTVNELAQRSELFSGDYNDLSNKPTIPAAQVQTDWNATSGMGVLLNKPTIPTVPVISTNISSDASSDVKTASPKAVKTYVDNVVGDIASVLDAINGEVI